MVLATSVLEENTHYLYSTSFIELFWYNQNLLLERGSLNGQRLTYLFNTESIDAEGWIPNLQYLFSSGLPTNLFIHINGAMED